MLEISFAGSKQVKKSVQKASGIAQNFCEKERTGGRAKKILPQKWDQENGLLRPISCSPAELIYTKHNL